MASKYRHFSRRLEREGAAAVDDNPPDAATPGAAENEKTPAGRILDEMGIVRLCCRRHMLTHVDLIEVI